MLGFEGRPLFSRSDLWLIALVRGPLFLNLCVLVAAALFLFCNSFWRRFCREAGDWMAEKKFTIDKQWLVKNRSEIQDRMLKLFEFGELLKERDAIKNFWPLYGLLVGVVFSLWRAVFLVKTVRKPKDERDHGIEFLSTLIETNAIGFSQDANNSQWTAGYYINSATMRLHAITKVRDARYFVSPETEVWLDKNAHPGLADLSDLLYDNLRPDWERALEGYDKVFRDMNQVCQQRYDN